MRTSIALLVLLVLAPSARAGTAVTVAQLEQFLTSSRAAKLSDGEIANRLSNVTLSEQLTSSTLNHIRTEANLGSSAEEQLDLLAAESIFEAPPASDLPSAAVPDADAQKQMIENARTFARKALHLVPDFLATRDTRYFSNVPIDTRKHATASIPMHLTRESRREIEIRDGQEIERALSGRPDTGDNPNLNSGLSSWGEFGALLTVVLGDGSGEAPQWNRWQRSASGIELAVFRYAIPRSSSHYTIDFCCFQKSLDEPVDYYFHDKPG